MTFVLCGPNRLGPCNTVIIRMHVDVENWRAVYVPSYWCTNTYNSTVMLCVQLFDFIQLIGRMYIWCSYIVVGCKGSMPTRAKPGGCSPRTAGPLLPGPWGGGCTVLATGPDCARCGSAGAGGG